MTVNIGQAVREGIDRTIAPSGIRLIAAFFVVSTLSGLLSIAGRPMDAMGPISPMPPSPSFRIPLALAGAGSLLLGIVSVVLTIVALRTFVTEETDQIPREHYSTNLLWPTINFIIGFIIFGILVGIGLVLLVIPGLFLLVSLFFWMLYVAVEDENFIDAFQHSWALTKGNRLELFLLGLVVAIISLVISAIFGGPGTIIGGSLGIIITQIGSAISTVFTTATAARTYRQLTTDDDSSSGVDTTGATG